MAGLLELVRPTFITALRFRELGRKKGIMMDLFIFIRIMSMIIAKETMQLWHHIVFYALSYRWRRRCWVREATAHAQSI